MQKSLAILSTASVSLISIVSEFPLGIFIVSFNTRSSLSFNSLFTSPTLRYKRALPRSLYALVNTY